MKSLKLFFVLALLLICSKGLHLNHELDVNLTPIKPCLFGSYQKQEDGTFVCKPVPPIRCPVGTFLKNGVCVPLLIKCPPGTIPTSGGGCRPIYSIPKDWI